MKKSITFLILLVLLIVSFTQTVKAVGISVTINAATSVSSTTATLSGTITTPVLDVSSYYFQYGTTTSYGSTATPSPSSATHPVNVTPSVNLSGLLPGTTYHFRLVAVSGSNFYSSDLSFTTQAANSSPTDIALSASSISENVIANSTVGTLSTTDPDAGNTFTYTLVTGTGMTDNASFNISGSNLQITNSPDYETKNSYSVRVRSTDQGGLYFEKAFTITINNVNETPSDIVLSASAINENVIANSTVGTLSTTDPDAGNTFTYTLVTGTGMTDNASFNISGNNLRITSSPDFEVKNSYSIRVRSTDQGSLFYEKAFIITINDVADAPVVTTQAVSSITSTTATGNGNITSLGIPNPTAYGVCWNTGGTPTTSDSKADNGAASATGTFTASMTGLTANTTYYVKAYATNNAGTSYGTEVNFTTSAIAPTVTTQAVSSIASTTATGNGNITSLGVPNPTQYGVVWSISTNPTTGLTTKTTQGSNSSTGAFTSSMTGLTANTTYYVKAYATNNAGTSYGAQVTFTTTVACANPSNGGVIANAQAFCGSFNPALLTSTSLPTGNTGTLQYQWQSSTDSINFSDLAVGTYTATTYDPSAITTTTWFRRQAKVTCESSWVSSNMLKMSVDVTSVAGTITGLNYTCDGKEAPLLTLSGQTGSVVKWQSSSYLNGLWTTFTDIVNTNTSYSPGVLSDTMKYRVSVKNGTCAIVYSPTKQILYRQNPTFTTGSISSPNCANDSITFVANGLLPSINNIIYYTAYYGTSIVHALETVIPNGNGIGIIKSFGFTPSNYSLIVDSINVQGCVTPFTGVVGNFTVNPLPTALISGTTSICKDAPEPLVTFTGAGGTSPYTFTYKINTGSNLTVTTTTGNSVAISAPTSSDGTYTYTLISVADANCSQIQAGDAVITVNTLPTASVSGTTSICKDAPEPLVTFTGAGGTAPYTFTYKINTGSQLTVTTTTGNSVTVAAPTSTDGTYTYTLISVADANCSQIQTENAVITVNPLPTASISGTTSVCINSTGNVYTTEAGMTGYTWNVSGGTITAGGTSPDNTATITWNTIGTDSLSVNYINTNSCTAISATIYKVTVNSLPVPTISGTTSVCINSTGNVYSTESGMTGYTWSIDGGIITAGSTTNAATVTWNTSGAKSISVNYTNVNSCAAASAIVYNVTVNAASNGGNISGGANVCNGTNSTLLTLSGQTGSVIKWQYTDDMGYHWYDINNTGTTNTATNLNTTTSFRAVVKSGVCDATPGGYANVTVQSLVTAGTIATAQTICNNTTPVALTSATAGTGSNIISYEWQTNASGSYVTVSSEIAAGYQPPTLTATTAYQRRTVSTNGSNVCYSDFTSPITITVQSTPIAGAIATAQTICYNTAPSGLTSATYGDGDGTITYEWQTNASGSYVTIASETSANYQPPTLTTTTAYQRRTVSTIGSNVCNSDYTFPITMTVYNAFAEGSIATTGESICYNTNPTTEIGNTTVASGGDNSITYEWRSSADSYATAISGATASTYTPAGPLTTTTSYQRYANDNTCNTTPIVSTGTWTITVNTLPVPTISGPTGICNNTTGNVYTTESGNTSYVWTVPGGTITEGSGTNTITVTWNIEGSQSVSVNYANSDGCTAATATVYGVTLKSAPFPVITGSPSDTYIVPKLATYQYSTPLVVGDLYSWSSPKIEGYCSESARNCVNVHFLDPCCVYGEWKISVTETNPVTGCSTIATKLIYITP